jgi:hypothetical protein
VRRLLLVSVLALLAPGAVAAEPLTKEQIIDRSAGICREMREAAAPHLERAQQAADQNQMERFIRESRRALAAVREVDPDLQDLVPPTGEWKYRRFVENGRTALDLLDAALDALEAGRTEEAQNRRASALDHLDRAKRAAQRYGLRRPCIRLVS